MSAKDNGGPAFPREAYVNPNGVVTRTGSDGMTLRDWFAGQAITAAAMQSFDDDATVEQNARAAARWAYCIADAMLAARGDA